MRLFLRLTFHLRSLPVGRDSAAPGHNIYLYNILYKEIHYMMYSTWSLAVTCRSPIIFSKCRSASENSKFAARWAYATIRTYTKNVLGLLEPSIFLKQRVLNLLLRVRNKNYKLESPSNELKKSVFILCLRDILL